MPVNYQIHLDKPTRPFPHYWELCVGSCHATTILREDVRQQIRNAHRDCGFQYLRFHGLFDDDMSVVIKPRMGLGEMHPVQSVLASLPACSYPAGLAYRR